MARTSSRRRVVEPRLDGLISLPTAVLDNILGRLRFDELVGTSRLSRAWRRRWQHVPNLDINFCEVSAAAHARFVLPRCASPLRSFTGPSIRWLLTLARKRVQKIVLNFDSRAVIGRALFFCRELTHLEIHGYGRFVPGHDCHLLRAPKGFVGFPNLVTLILDDVVLPFPGGGAQLERLISSAPHLRVLTLDDVRTGLRYDFSTGEEPCLIHAPNLRILKLIAPFDNGCRLSEDLPLLEEAHIFMDDMSNTSDFIQTFGWISNVKRLSLVHRRSGYMSS